jgi:DNA polymerase-1
MQQQGNETGDEPRTETLYVIDGYASIFRAYYAIRNPLRSHITGESTQAIFVFAQMLLKLYTTLKPDYVVVAMDAPGPTFREEVYSAYVQASRPPTAIEPLPPTPTAEITEEPVAEEPRYKGNRPAIPDDFHQQVIRILEMLEMFSIPVLHKPGLEADDVIATLTGRILEAPQHAHVKVRIASPDKDLEQLLEERVTLFDIHTGKETDTEALRLKRDILPSQVVDYLAMTGDAVDNIPGVPGIGAKTAAKLLQEYGSLEGIFENLSQVRERWRVSLEQARPLLPYSQRLITLKKDPELPFALQDARVGPIPAEELSHFFEMMGFGRLTSEMRSLHVTRSC